MKQNLLFNRASALGKRLAMVLTMLLIVGIGQAWGAEGDVLKTYDTNSSTFATGYSRKTGDNFVWWGQKGYYGANNATNHGNLKPTASDLPVVKAQNSSATTSTTGYYYLYTSEAIANVGKVEIKFTAKSGSSTVNAYIVSSSTKAASGSATWTKVTLASNSSKAQGANVATAATYTFTFDATETDAKYYGVVFVTSSYWRATNLTFKLYEGAPVVTEPYTVKFYKTSTTFESETEVSAGDGVTPPTMEEECGDWTFQGWSESPSNSETSTTELELVTLTDGKYYPTEDVNLYPVYTKSEGGGGIVTWNKVTTAPADWSGEYLIVNSNYAMTSDFHSGTSGEFKGASVTVSNNQVTSSLSDKMIWIVEKNGSSAQYSFKNKSTGTYAKITGTSSTNAALSSSVIWFTISSSSTSGVWKINSVDHSARCFAYYSTNKTFRTYANSSNTTGNLYKKEGSSSTTYYYSYPQCTTETAVYLIPKNSDFWMAYLRRIFGCKCYPAVASHTTRLPIATSSHPLPQSLSRGIPSCTEW